MRQQRIKVDTSDLKPGMYVAELDRPWIETPFLFQGFFVRTQEEIESLQHHCRYVYIDLERGEGPSSVERAMGGTTTPQQDETQQQTSGIFTPPQGTPEKIPPASVPRPNRTFYQDSTPVEEEITAARKAHLDVTRVTLDVIKAIRQGHKLDISAIKHAADPMVESVLRNPDAMIWLARMQKVSAYVYSHSVSCSVWCVAFGRHLGLDRTALNDLAVGGLLFDVGKVKLPPALLSKPSKLTEEEYTLVKQHVEHGVKILQESEGVVSERVMQMVHSHHERFDGSGYPDGIKGNQIPTFAKIAAMVDSYDAITSIRPYAKPLSSYDAVREIYKWRNKTLQAEVVEQFIQVVGIFPTGTLVELSTGAVGVVISQNRARRLKPKLMMVLDEDKQPIRQFSTMDMLIESEKGDDVWIEKSLEPGSYNIDPQEFYL